MKNMNYRVFKICMASVLALMVASVGIGSVQAQEVVQTPPPETLVSAVAPVESAPVTQGEQKAVSLGTTAESLNAEEEDLAPEVQILRKIEKELEERKKHERYTRSSIPSLVFTAQQYALLREARVGFNTRSPTLQELRDPGDPNDPNYRRTSLLREVVLGGIAYSSPDDWTIWLNNARVTPDAIPADAVDLKVYKDFIELRWHDVKTDQIYPIRLRPNQKFNLDVHMFLPG